MSTDKFVLQVTVNPAVNDPALIRQSVRQFVACIDGAPGVTATLTRPSSPEGREAQ